MSGDKKLFEIVNRNCQRRRIMNRIDRELPYVALARRLNAISARRRRGER